ncbi:MAG: glycosyltransferase family 4 protein [Gammaproteobacteria bacterium]
MNILVIPHVGGSYNSLRPEAEIYISLAKAGINIIILANPESPIASYFLEAGITVIPFKPNRKISISAIKTIRRAIDQHDIQLVYATYSRNISNAAFACIGKPVKFIAYRGTTGGLYRSDPTSYLGILHPRIDGVICVSKAVADHVRPKVAQRIRDRVVAIYKGHKLQWYHKPPAPLEPLGSRSSNFNVICVANARIHKGLVYLLRALPQVADLEDLHVILVGKDIDRQPYRSLIDNSGMRERIHLTGYRDDAPEIIAACDTLVSPSLREGLPRVLLEALAYKVPVITADNPGSLEIINDTINGFVVPRENADAIAEKIRELHDHPAIREKFAEHAHDKLLNEMSHEKTVTNMIRYFQAVLD